MATKVSEAATQQRQYSYQLTTELKPVPLSEAVLKMDLKDLKKLPPDAVFSARSGQATARAEIKGDTVFLFAICDSLSREVEKLETYLSEMKLQTTEKTTQTGTNILTVLKHFFSGVLSGLFLLPLIKLLIKKIFT